MWTIVQTRHTCVLLARLWAHTIGMEYAGSAWDELHCRGVVWGICATRSSATQEGPPMEDRLMKPQARAERLGTGPDRVARPGPALPRTGHALPAQTPGSPPGP